jgi:hypothetical protein
VRRALRLWPALAAAAAAALALLAHGVLAAADDARSGAPPGLLARAGESLVGTRDDRDLRHALALEAAADRPRLAPGAAFRRRALAEQELARSARSGPAAERARAAHALALAALRDGAVDRANAAAYAAAAVASLRDAIRLDPLDSESKLDLELLLSARARQQGQHGGKHSRGAAGAGAARPGRGY